jgi:SAM-dependent methyltransferase
MSPVPLMYSEIAHWWPLVSRPEDYEEEAAFYVSTLTEAVARKPQEVLELGSGGGNNASHMKNHFSLTLADVAPEMLAVSRKLNPECVHVQGDMRTIRLEREFDAVFVHDAIAYMTSLPDLAAAVETAFVHTSWGGAALFCPDHTRENFRESTDHGGHDGEDRALRYLEWTWDPDPADTVHLTDYVYLLREGDGTARVRHDRHECGLFSERQWLDTLSAAGFEASVLPFFHSEVEIDAVVFLGRKQTS